MKNLSFKDIKFILEALEELLKSYTKLLEKLETTENESDEDKISDLSNDCLFLEELITEIKTTLEQGSTPNLPLN